MSRGISTVRAMVILVIISAIATTHCAAGGAIERNLSFVKVLQLSQ
jgi:hypothetical protein